MNAPALIAGPYVAPRLRRADRAFCYFRDADVKITSISAARIAWPRCQVVGQRGGSGLLVDEELRRAILTESAAALRHWWGASVSTIAAWRAAFGVTQFGTEGSKGLHDAASQRGADATRGCVLTAEQVERRRRTAHALHLGRFLKLHGQPGNSRPWTADEVAQLGTDADEVVAARTGRTADAVRLKRSRAGIPTYRDRRRR